MMSSKNDRKSFEHQLESLETGTGEGQNLKELRQLLRDSGQASSRSDQHQNWAWTRLQEELKQPQAGTASAWAWLFSPKPVLALTCATAMALLYIGLQGNRDLSAQSLSPQLWAGTFETDDAQVVWVTGYDYIPASNSLQ